MKELDDFQRIIVLKCLRPDKVTNAMQDFVAQNLGQKFIEPQVCMLCVEQTREFFFHLLVMYLRQRICMLFSKIRLLRPR
jgi:hypothetical protein